MYCAFIGDMLHSKKIPISEREIVRKNMERLLNDINERFSVHISANFTITLGDEFQGLLNESAYSLEIIEYLSRGMHPRKIRIAVGIGDMNTAIDPKKALGADGSAFHNARKAIDMLKNSEKKMKTVMQSSAPLFWAMFETGAPDTALINLNCGFISKIVSKWTEKQWDTIKAVVDNEGNQSGAARQLGFGKSTVSRNLKAARYDEYKAALVELSAYLQKTYDSGTTESVRLQQADNLIESAIYLTDEFDYDLALAKHKEALTLRRMALGNDNALVAESLDYVGYIYLKKKNGKDALKYFEEALEIKSLLDIENKQEKIAQSQQNLGDVFYLLAQYDKAWECYENALETHEKEDPATANTYSGIANVYYAQGDYAKALEWYEKSLAICEKVLGKEHPDTARSYDNIAGVYYAQGDYAKALEWYEKALEIREKVLGKEHPYTKASYNNIASVYVKQGEFEKALEWYKKANTTEDSKYGL